MELEARVSELEMELSVWKRAHSVALEASERDNMHVASLQQASTPDDFERQSGDPLVLCVINGQQTFFHQTLLTQGFMGGQSAAQHLTRAISEYLTSEDIQITGRLTFLSFWVSIYFNKSELVNMLVGQSICSREQLEGFLAGFSETSPRFTAVDVGIGEGAADRKIREYIRTYTRLPETLRTFLGGCHESNALYSGAFDCLQSENLLEKLVILRGLSEDWSDHTFPIHVLNVDKLLVQQAPHPSMQQLAPLRVPFLEPAPGPSNGGLVSPQSPVRNGVRYPDPRYVSSKVTTAVRCIWLIICVSICTNASTTRNYSLLIDLLGCTENPPPCNEHYLMACSKGAGACKYSHDYILSPEQLAVLAANAKKAPCNWLKSGADLHNSSYTQDEGSLVLGLQCPYGELCCWGHVCPGGSHCFHLRKGKCWFKGGEWVYFHHQSELLTLCRGNA
ncbi:hypothetical protein F5050DRAFT_1789604 [Lentinula boryana]|uniref:C3H1-type domain-containing protein n=1 Tax=Lentinula boryana TaxID=40481 RepID=A0ABQ8Q1G2_9AGAR|nr:hypothetical protein F5050DRAFT_1789604 [Lentinula boryana]